MNPIINALATNAANLFLALILGGAITGAGFLFLKLAVVAIPSPGTKLFFAFSAGAAVTGYAVFALASFGLLSPVPLSLFLLVLAATARFGWRDAAASGFLPADLFPRGKVERLAAALLVVTLAAGLLLALAPETGRDALIYHLNLPRLFLKHGGFYSVPGSIYAHFPLHTEMLYLIGLFLRGDVVAKLLNYTALLLVLLGVRELGRARLGADAPVYLTMLVLCTLPTVFYEAHIAYIDIFVTLYAMAAVWAFLNWEEGNGRGWLLLSAAFCGTAMACKYTALFLPLLGVAAVLRVHLNTDHRAKPLRDVGIFLLVVTLFGSPFYLKSWIETGNPLYPFFYGLFGGTGWEPRQAELFEGLLMFIGMGRSLPDFLLLPWNISFHAQMHTPRFDGIIGPVFLLVLPFLAGLRPLPAWLRTVLAYCGLTFFFWASGSQQLRFLLPLFPFLALATGFVVSGYRTKRAASCLLLGSIAIGVALNGRHIYRELTTIRPAGVVLGTETRDDFLRRSISSYGMYRYINSVLPADASIFLVCMKNMTFLCDRTCYSDTMFEQYTLQKILAQASSPEEVRRALLARGFSHILYDENLLLGDKSLLAPREKALFAQFRDKHLKPVHRDLVYSLSLL